MQVEVIRRQETLVIPLETNPVETNRCTWPRSSFCSTMSKSRPPPRRRRTSTNFPVAARNNHSPSTTARRRSSCRRRRSNGRCHRRSLTSPSSCTRPSNSQPSHSTFSSATFTRTSPTIQRLKSIENLRCPWFVVSSKGQPCLNVSALLLLVK